MIEEEKFKIIIERAKDFIGFEENPEPKWWVAHRGRRYLMLLFSHEFAQAYWGKGWKEHIQKAVLSGKPLDYYLKNHETTRL